MLLKTYEELKFWRDIRWHVTVATGCFDVLHVGHIRLLREAKRLGSFLLVGINSDASVRQLKGNARPINNQEDRAEMLLSLSAVNAVFVFDDLRATRFLAESRPQVWVKGGDYTLETLDQDERKAVESAGGQILLYKTVKGYSTTATLAKQGQEFEAYAGSL